VLACVLSSAAVARAQAPPAAAPPEQTVPAPPAPGQSPPAHDQKAAPRPFLDGRFMLGVSGSHVLTPDSDLGQRWSLSPVIRNTPRRYGWSPVVGLNWYTGNITVPVNGQQTVVGEIKLRPVMAGIGYSIGRGPTRTTIGLVAGYAFNSATVARDLPAGTTAAISVTNAWVVRPSVTVTYALTRRLAVVSSIGYVYMDPTIRVAVGSDGQQVSRVLGSYRSDYINFTLGTAFSVF
jgi:hypothetical protein